MKERLKGYVWGVLVLVVAFLVFFQLEKLTGNVTKDQLNLEVEIPKDYSKILAGEKLWFTTKILNLANKQRMDITLDYEIFDWDKKLIAKKSETVAIETQASFVGEIQIPVNALPGDYILSVSVVQLNNIILKSERSFQVRAEKDFENFFEKNLVILIIAIFVLAVIIILLGLKSKIKAYLEKRKLKSQISAIVKSRG